MNNLKLSIITISALAFLVLSSCNKDHCEEFDLTHETMEWHFFPDLMDSYRFFDLESNQINFFQTHYSRSNEREVGGIQRACYPQLRTKYVSDTLQVTLENIAIYEALEGNVQSSIYYNVDNIECMIDVEDNMFEPFIDDQNYFKEYEIKHLDTITLNSRPYYNLTQLEIIDISKSDIQLFWVQQNTGIIGFQIDNRIWLR